MCPSPLVCVCVVLFFGVCVVFCSSVLLEALTLTVALNSDDDDDAVPIAQQIGIGSAPQSKPYS